MTGGLPIVSAQLRRAGPSTRTDAPGPGQPHHFFHRPGTGVAGDDEEAELVPLQPLAYPVHPGATPPPRNPRPRSPEEPAHDSRGASSGSIPRLSSVVSSARKFIRSSTASGVMPGSFVISSRSRSRTSFSVV